MNRDGVPNAIYSDHQRVTEGQYVVVSSQFVTQSFAEAVADAERCCRTVPTLLWGIYKLDSTFALVNGVIVVRSAE